MSVSPVASPSNGSVEIEQNRQEVLSEECVLEQKEKKLLSSTGYSDGDSLEFARDTMAGSRSICKGLPEGTTEVGVDLSNPKSSHTEITEECQLKVRPKSEFLDVDKIVEDVEKSHSSDSSKEDIDSTEVKKSHKKSKKHKKHKKKSSKKSQHKSRDGDVIDEG